MLAIELDQKYKEAHLNIGIVRLKKDDLKGAEQSFKRALQLDENYREAHDNLVIVLKMKDDLATVQK